jgi:hypothetical protein
MVLLVEENGKIYPEKAETKKKSKIPYMTLASIVPWSQRKNNLKNIKG